MLILSLIIIKFSNSERIHSCFSNITIKIMGPGTKNILYGDECLINSVKSNIILPDEIYLNDIKQTDIKVKYDLDDKLYIIKLVWNNITSNCNCLFKDCIDIFEIDFSGFDFSQGLSANQMFSNCTSLTSLNLHDFGTIKIINSGSMFSFCSSLIFLNLSQFDVTTVSDMGAMFYGCHLLTSLDLSNFITSQVSTAEMMFYDCPNLVYLNLKNAHFCHGNTNINNFLLASKNIVLCTGCDPIRSLVNNYGCAMVNCTENWKQNQKKLNIESNECVTDCSLTNNKYNYISKCFTTCPNGTYNNNFICESCHPDCKICDKSLK